MFKLLKRQSHKAGLAPGSLVHVGETKEHEVSVSTIVYDSENDPRTGGAGFRSSEKVLPG